MGNPWKNAEGYTDPTAYEGLKPIIREETEQQKRVNALIYVLKYIIRAAGFELLNRIEIKDSKTGREYR
ncbi:hypothetical protein D7X33_08220 [Butyricicoccus sp. 1XD8-22]|jgi:hypothetical protein|nr:hypothetical protein D7X33_08220 [Butyricicoccus sp. 1XD8-22]